MNCYAKASYFTITLIRAHYTQTKNAKFDNSCATITLLLKEIQTNPIARVVLVSLIIRVAPSDYSVSLISKLARYYCFYPSIIYQLARRAVINQLTVQYIQLIGDYIVDKSNINDQL